MTSRRTDLLFHAGGEAVEQYGTIVRKTLRDDDNGYTATRSGTVGPYVDFDGVLRAAAANIPRVDWQDGDAYLLLEATRTNLVTSDDFSAWTAVQSPTVTGSVSDPAGGTGAYTIHDSGAGNLEYIYHGVTFTGDATTTAVFVVRENTMPASGSQDLLIVDATAGLSRLRLKITAWSNGEPTVTASTGTYLGKREIGNGYWALYGEATGVVVGNTNRLRIEPANSNSVSGSIDVYRANAYNNNVPGFSILDASEFRRADSFYADFPYPPQAMTLYVKFVERGTLAGAIPSSERVVHIGSTSSVGYPRFLLYAHPDGVYKCAHDNGTTTVVAGTTSTLSATSYGDVVELRGVLNADGSVTIGQSINSGTEETSTDSTAVTLGTAWADTRIWINSVGSAFYGVSQYRSVKVARGAKTMAEMRAL
jgi:hypothetical protein